MIAPAGAARQAAGDPAEYGLARGHGGRQRAAGAIGLAEVNPIPTWVRLAQRVPAGVHIARVPAGVRLVASTTATVAVDPRAAAPRSGRRSRAKFSSQCPVANAPTGP